MKYPVNDKRNDDPEDAAEVKAGNPPSKAEEAREDKKPKLYSKGAVQAARIIGGKK